MIKINGKELNKSFTFSGGERQIRLPELELNLSDKDNRKIVIDCKLKSSDDIMDMLLVSNAIWHNYAGWFHITFNVWYLPYARQDRICYTGEAFSTEVMRGVLDLVKCQTLNVADIHSPQLFSNSKVVETTVLDIFKANPDILKGITALVAPDKGSVKKVESIANHFNLPVIYYNKVRDTESGWITDYEVVKGIEHISGGNLLVVDDICDGGKTFELLSESLDRFRVSKADTISLYITHGIFSKGIDKLDDMYDKIITTDSWYEEDYLNVKVIEL